LFKETEILPDAVDIESPADVGRDSGIHGLDANLELQGPGRESGQPFLDRLRKMVRNDLEVHVEGWRFRQEIVENPRGRGRIGVEGAVDELEGPCPPLPEGLHLGQKPIYGKGPHPSVDRAEAEFAAEGATARGLDIGEAVGHVVVGVEGIG